MGLPLLVPILPGPPGPRRRRAMYSAELSAALTAVVCTRVVKRKCVSGRRLCYSGLRGTFVSFSVHSGRKSPLFPPPSCTAVTGWRAERRGGS